MTVPVGAAGVRGLGGRGYLAYTTGGGVVGRGTVGNGAGGPSYSLKADKQTEEKLYDLLPGMELTPLSLKAAAIKPAPQVTGSDVIISMDPVVRRCFLFVAGWRGHMANFYC